MPTPGNTREGHMVLRLVLITLALGVLIASAMMWWWVHESDDGSLATGQATTTAEVEASSS